MVTLRKSPRLKDFDYAGQYAYSLTFVTRRRGPLFRDSGLVEVVEEALLRASEQQAFTLHAFCFMPDHAHVLVSGEDESRLPAFFRLFKQLSGYRAKQLVGQSIWQISYYDHVVRRDEDLREIMRYIWNNPVRAGLASEPADYPYSGPRPLAIADGQA